MAKHELGLRERKKAKTRLAISQVATRMFNERGFDAVTVAEVAAAAEVSVATIFNYFETKEDLFFDREGEVLAAHVRFIRDRAAGESIVAALHRGLRAAIDGDALPRLLASGGAFVRTLEASPALRDRARRSLDKTEAALAEVIAEDTAAIRADATPRIVAGMVMAIERMLIEDARAAVLRGDAATAAKRRLRRSCDQAFELLERGVAGYGRRASSSARTVSAQ